MREILFRKDPNVKGGGMIGRRFLGPARCVVSWEP